MEIRCVCPPKADGSPRHEKDTIELREKMDFRSSIAIRNALAVGSLEGDLDIADILAILSERFIRYGIVAWSIVDAHNKPVPATQQTIAEIILPEIDVATEIADEADGRYRDAVLLPLLQRASMSSQPSPTSASTSRTTASSTKRRMPRSRSSITTIPTVATVTTSDLQGGDFSSSPKSA